MAKLKYDVMVKMGISETAIKEFIEHRKLLKKPLTQGALERNMREAVKGVEFGLTPEQVIYETIDAGWQGIKAQWVANRLRQPVQKTRDRPLSEALTDRSWAEPNHQ